MRIRALIWCVIATWLVAMGGCGGSTIVNDTFAQKVSEPTTLDGTPPVQAPRARIPPTPPGEMNTLAKEIRPEIERGSGRMVLDKPIAIERQPLPAGGEGITLNLNGVPVAQAAKAILGDILKVNYVVDEKVQGTLTVQTSRPVAQELLIDILEMSLKANGATLLRSSGVYRIVPAAGTERAPRPITVGTTGAPPGAHVRIIPLQYVSAAEMGRVLEPVAPPRSILRLDDARSLIVLGGTADELKMLQDLIQIFDVDWMKGLSFGLFPVKSSAPEEIAKELEAVFGSGREGPLSGTLKFLPNRRLSAILVITSRPAYLDRARDWITKLDRQAERSEEQMFVYKIQNRPAEQLASLLTQVLSQEQRTAQIGPTAPRVEPGTVTSTPLPTGPSVQQQPAITTARRPENPAIDFSGDPAYSFRSPAGAQPRQQVARIVADEANNAVLVYATRKDWDRIRQILERMDTIATQVLIEAVIAEVTLNDELRFGLRWFLEKGPSQFKLSDAITGAVAPVFPGFSYFFSIQHIQVALNAVAAITNVRVVSAPSLVVADNRTARLQVGDQVPIVTQTTQSVAVVGAPIVSTVTMKDTGIILAVTPRVSDSGRVNLDIEQEASNVARTTTSGIDSPTIQQRKIKTTVTVSDGQVLVLGGLIQQRENVVKTEVPLLGSLPVVGNAFRHKEDRIEKTELLIFIRPRVVRDNDDARRITDEFRNQLEFLAPRQPQDESKLHRDLRRLTR